MNKWSLQLPKKNTLEKNQLRKILLERRQAVSTAERTAAANSAAQLLMATTAFQQSQHIAVYYPMPAEFDSVPIIHAIWTANKKCYLPVLHGDILQFAEYHPHTVLKLNQYKIPEPLNSPIVPIAQLELILMPLVGFDLQGNRLGMGGGYYDRTFAQKTQCQLIGLAYAIQQCSKLPHDEWDVLLDGVVTETSILYPKLFRGTD